MKRTYYSMCVPGWSYVKKMTIQMNETLKKTGRPTVLVIITPERFSSRFSFFLPGTPFGRSGGVEHPRIDFLLLFYPVSMIEPQFM